MELIDFLLRQIIFRPYKRYVRERKRTETFPETGGQIMDNSVHREDSGEQE